MPADARGMGGRIEGGADRRWDYGQSTAKVWQKTEAEAWRKCRDGGEGAGEVRAVEQSRVAFLENVVDPWEA